MLNLTVETRPIPNPIPMPIPISIHKWRGQLNQKQLKCKAADNPERGCRVGGSIIITVVVVVVGFVGAVVVTLMRLPAPMICIFLLKCRRAY